jgi:hypothetical protein
LRARKGLGSQKRQSREEELPSTAGRVSMENNDFGAFEVKIEELWRNSPEIAEILCTY